MLQSQTMNVSSSQDAAETPLTDLPASMSEFDQAVERNFKHNFIVNSLDGAAYWFGYSFIAPAIILPLYLSHFTHNPLIIGLIPFLSTGGFLLPQLFTANLVERSPIKKFYPVNIGFFSERMPVLMIAVTAALFAKTSPALALGLFLLCYTWYSFGAGLIIVGWQDMVAKIIPFDRRGRFFGISNFAGSASGVVGALAVVFVLERFPFPQGFVFSFFAAAVLIYLSWYFISLTREPPLYIDKPKVSQTEYLRSLPALLRKDPNFRQYLLFQILFSFSGMAGGFLIVYTAKVWNLPDSQAGGYVLAMQIGQSLANLFFGFLADRKGHKISLEITALVSAASFLLSLLATSPMWFYPIFFLRGVATAGALLSGISIVLEFTAPKDRPTYIGLANTLPGIASSLAPLIGGLIAQIAGYAPMFLISSLIGLLSFGVLRWKVREPRAAQQTVAANGVPK